MKALSSLSVIFILLISIFSITVNLGLGFGQSTDADVTVTDQWIGKTRPLQARADIMNAVVVEGKIYTIAGGFLTGTVKDTEMYDPQTDTWTTKTPMPTPRLYFASAAYENKIYCIGGHTELDTFLGLNEVYDTLTDSWTNMTAMPTPRAYLQANEVNGKIYLIGGQTPTESDRYGIKTNVNEAYDPQTDTWETKTPMPHPEYWYSSAVVDNKIYIIGGLTQIYDTETDTWTNGTACPQVNWVSAAAATTGQYAPVRIYVLGGGYGFFEIAYDDFNRIYDPANDSWSFGAPLPKALGKLAAVNINDTIYALGGIVFAEINANINAQYIPANYSYQSSPSPEPTPSALITPTPLPTTNATPSATLTPAHSPTAASPTPLPSIRTVPSGSESATPLGPASLNLLYTVVIAVVVVVAVLGVVVWVF
jgi:hypothetical protein